ncbi:hypothetical protein Metal_3875 [Methylomicrobium album BG8]|uniref:Uncharacterized protein n=1 Tax=Methylomicrobium album BG8 TaxID=686340 RepID=H8GJ08_METAL|nr:hypothetical protein Metal_3875 [Methylomicrobium album BG8]
MAEPGKAGSALRVTGYGLRVTGYGLRVTGYGLRVFLSDVAQCVAILNNIFEHFILGESLTKIRPQKQPIKIYGVSLLNI